MESHWSSFVCMALALWLISAPPTMGYWGSPLGLSDLLSGAALLLLSGIQILSRDSKVRWTTKWALCCVGLWLTAAPLVFWAPDAASYASDTLIGSLVIIAAAIVPSFRSADDVGAEIPPGWSYNPSAWRQRIPILGLALLGFLMARYLSAFQLGHIKSAWDPFFGKGTETILTSDVSRAFPVSDAGLGAWSYLLDAMAGALGGTRRWRSAPWVVVLFGFMVIPPGVTSITLVVLQPLAVGAWCTLCLATAVVMLLMVPPAIDEVVASAQFLIRARRQGHSLWRVFWHGAPGVTMEEAPVRPENVIPVPWTLAVSSMLGAWLMLSPALFRAEGMAADSNHLLGALIATFAVIAMAQVARPLRFAGCLFGLALIVGIWFVDGGSSAFQWNSAVVGALLLALSIPLGPIRDHFGTYDLWVHWTPFRP